MAFASNLLQGLLHGIVGFFLFLGSSLGQSSISYTTLPPQPIPQPTVESAVFPHAPSTAMPASRSATPKIPLAIVALAPQPLPVPIQVSPKSPDEVNAETRASLVNILCTTKAGGYFHPISGSGVTLGDGVILTNAHVGQYLLLRDYLVQDNVDCVVRTGSPATAAYRAELLYLPPAWIDKNATQIISPEATGDGENDYAFLLITATTDGSPLPASPPAISLTTDEPFRSEQLLLAAYPAGYLGGSTIQDDLYASSALTTVGDLYSFAGTSTVDLISVGSTIISQAGSSGGAVVRAQDGALTGIIATATVGTTTESRLLRAITIAHINRSLASEGQRGILSLLTGNLTQKAADFNKNVAPAMTQKLVDVLKKK